MSEHPLEPLGSICEINSDTLTEASDPTRRYRYIDLSSIKEQKADLSITPLPFAVLPSRARRRVAFNDVLLGTVRPNLKNFAIIDSEDEDLLCSTGFAVLRSKANASDPRFIFHAINSEIVARQLNALVTGSNYPAVNATQVGELLIPVPPLPEQRKIAEILSGIDLRIKLGEQKIAHLEVLLKSLGDKFFGNQSQYETKTIGEIFEVSSGTTPSRSRQDYFCTKGGTPWAKTMDLNDNYIRTTDEQLTRTGIQEGRAKIFPAGTLLIAMYGGWNQIGRTGILAKDSSCNQAMSALLPAKEVLPEFLNLQLVIRRSYWKGVAASSRKDPNITKSDVTNMPIAIPALIEQHEITNALGSVLRHKSSECQYLENLNLLKSALALDLLSGRKRVSV